MSYTISAYALVFGVLGIYSAFVVHKARTAAARLNPHESPAQDPTPTSLDPSDS